MAKTQSPTKSAAWKTHKILKESMPHLTYNQVLFAMRQKARLDMPYEEFEALLKKLGSIAKQRRIRRSRKSKEGKKND